MNIGQRSNSQGGTLMRYLRRCLCLTAILILIASCSKDETIHEKNFRSPETNKLPFGHLDVAYYKDGIFQASGWAADTEDSAPIQKVMVYIDNKLLGKASMGFERPDVAKHFNTPKWSKSGWQMKAKIPLSKEQHTVSAYAYDSMEVPVKFSEEVAFVVQ
jgi:hypothetical protein